jgi:hypothetical protein
MTLKIHRSIARLERRHARLTSLRDRIRQQINDADYLLATLEEFCREHPDDCACAGNDPNWREQIISQREDLAAMLLAIRDRLN